MIFKRSELGLRVLCAWNNISPERAPAEWRDHLNESTAQGWNRVIKAVRDHDRELGEQPHPVEDRA